MARWSEAGSSLLDEISCRWVSPRLISGRGATRKEAHSKLGKDIHQPEAEDVRPDNLREGWTGPTYGPTGPAAGRRRKAQALIKSPLATYDGHQLAPPEKDQRPV